MIRAEKVQVYFMSNVFLKTWQNSKLAYFMSSCSHRTDKQCLLVKVAKAYANYLNIFGNLFIPPPIQNYNSSRLKNRFTLFQILC